jgi:hypothetical protein
MVEASELSMQRGFKRLTVADEEVGPRMTMCRTLPHDLARPEAICLPSPSVLAVDSGDFALDGIGSDQRPCQGAGEAIEGAR